jgi:bacterioferritin-associated ferredoxin
LGGGLESGDALRLNLNFLVSPARCRFTMVSAVCPTDCTLRPVCHCLGVTEGEIRETIAEQDLHTVRQVAQTCGAGGGCTACHRHIKRYLQEAAQERMGVQRQTHAALEYA